MLSLEQIKRLENRVYKAVELLKAMKEENNILKSELKSANERVEELEQIISDYRNNQLEIEQGIVKAIQQLDDLDSIDDNLSEISEGPVDSVSVKPEAEHPAGIESPSGAASPWGTQDSVDIPSSETEQESVIPAAAGVISDSGDTSFSENEVKVSEPEPEPEESTRQLDIF